MLAGCTLSSSRNLSYLIRAVSTQRSELDERMRRFVLNLGDALGWKQTVTDFQVAQAMEEGRVRVFIKGDGCQELQSIARIADHSIPLTLVVFSQEELKQPDAVIHNPCELASVDWVRSPQTVGSWMALLSAIEDLDAFRCSNLGSQATDEILTALQCSKHHQLTRFTWTIPDDVSDTARVNTSFRILSQLRYLGPEATSQVLARCPLDALATRLLAEDIQLNLGSWTAPYGASPEFTFDVLCQSPALWSKVRNLT